MYAVVGVLEDFNTTIAVMEQYVPQFFRGAVNTYFDNIEDFKETNKNNFKPPVSEKIKEVVRRNFTREIEFYQFCRQRLHRQFFAANLR
jgi:dermatan/chondrotin sulfate uronyl 2-O-sulfotransferase UST